MFKKVIVIDARGHLQGRLASYVAKQLLSGNDNVMQVKESWWCAARASTSRDPSSETKPNSQSSYAKDSSPILVVLSSTTALHPAFSGEASEACSLTRLQEEPQL